MVKILQGMRIIEGSAFVAAPLAGMTLAQMGAEVLGLEADDAGSLRAQLQVLRGETDRALRWADGFTTPVSYHFWHCYHR